MTEKKVNTKIPVIFQNIEEYENKDVRFLKVKIWLMHTGVNFNFSSFSKSVVEKAIPSLANTPILAFIEESNTGELDFSDHRMVLHRTKDGDLDIKYLGQAVGVIPETNNAHWEKRVSDSGEEKEYLVVDALMWTKWDEPIDIMKNKYITSQSMELADDYTGFFDENGIFHFDSFKFFGACLLGDDVLPAMENSTVEVQFSNNNNINKEIEEKLNEFYTLFSQKGGNELVEEVKQEFEETTENSLEQVDITEDFTTTETSQDETQFEQEEVVVNEETVEENQEVDKEFEDSEETHSEDVEEVSSLELTEETFSKEFVEGLQAQINSLTSEIESLASYKRQREEQDLASKFTDKLTNEEISEVFETSKEFELDVVEEKLLAKFGKKNFSIKEQVKVEVETVNFSKVSEVKNDPYGGLFEQFLETK